MRDLSREKQRDAKIGQQEIFKIGAFLNTQKVIKMVNSKQNTKRIYMRQNR